jgi:thiol-disulfide isomerase/thioredoxin
MKRQFFPASALFLCGLAAALSPGAARAVSVWHNDTESAFAEARKSGKPVLVDLYADWCGWCKTMEREVFTQAKFQTYAERFVLLRVDVEDGASGSDLQRRFRADSLPTLLLLDPKQSLLGKIEGYLETDRLIARLDGELRAYDAFLAAYDIALASTDPLLWRSRARELHARGDGGRSAVLLERLVRDGGLTGEELAWTRLQLADAYRMDGRFAEAKRTAAELRKALAASPGTAQTPGTEGLVERVDLLLVFIAGGERDCAGAAGALASFERGHPRSPYLADARRAYSALKSDSTALCS